MIRLYGEVEESLHLFLPAAPLSVSALAEIGVDPGKVGLHYEGGFRDPLIERIAWAIRDEMIDPAPAGKMLVETLASALGAHILRHHSNLKRAPLPAARGALDSRRLRRVAEFVEAHLGEDLTLGRLAREACLSPFHFARAFKAATGTAPHRYLTVRRIDRARALIADGELTLAEIADACGFSSQAHFTRSFKRFVGATPGEHRSGGSRALREASHGSATMNLTNRRQGDVRIVEASGRIDAANVEAFSEAVQGTIGDADRAMILDLAGISYMGSTGLRAILLIAKALEDRDVGLVLCALPAPLRRVFEITGFDRLLPIRETRAEALASLDAGTDGAQAP